MAESALEKLKRLAREKREAAAKAEGTSVTNEESTDVISKDTLVSSIPPGNSLQSVHSSDDSVAVLGSPDSNSSDAVSGDLSPTQLTEPVTLQKASRNHPLVREMEELEAALEQNVPGFVTILRDIHKKLAEDPLTVTLLSLEERGTIVKGMTRHANVTIATKAVSKTGSRKKVAISASDL